MIIRDHDGRFLSGRANWYGSAYDAMMMEAMACRDGIQWAREAGVSKLCLETDCLELVNLWKMLRSQRSRVSLILQDIKSISTSFDEFAFVYANRTCNRAAHVCAREVSCEFRRVEWHQNPPNSLRNLLENDCNHVLV